MQVRREKPILNWQIALLLIASAFSLSGINATPQKQLALAKMQSRADFASTVTPAPVQPLQQSDDRKPNSLDPNF